MSRIHRPWVRRIGGYVPGTVFKRDPDGKPLGEEEEGQDALAVDPDGDIDGEQDEEQAQQGDTEADAPGDEQEEAEGFGLEVPEEVEERRREEEEKRRRTPINRGLAQQAFGLEGHYLRNLATRFARMVSKVAEDSADLPMAGDDEWDFAELMRRRFTGRMIHQCRMTREKRKVAVVLDTSPSCEQQARLFGSIARIAEELGDCDLYDAPNFVISALKTGDQWVRLGESLKSWDFRGRVVLAFGDFDGIDRISEASAIRGNKIYWFCCEERPQVLEHYRETFLKHYKGRYMPATNLGQLLTAMRRVR